MIERVCLAAVLIPLATENAFAIHAVECAPQPAYAGEQINESEIAVRAAALGSFASQGANGESGRLTLATLVTISLALRYLDE
jgi:hypothetical protein